MNYNGESHDLGFSEHDEYVRICSGWIVLFIPGTKCYTQLSINNHLSIMVLYKVFNFLKPTTTFIKKQTATKLIIE